MFRAYLKKTTVSAADTTLVYDASVDFPFCTLDDTLSDLLRDWGEDPNTFNRFRLYTWGSFRQSVGKFVATFKDTTAWLNVWKDMTATGDGNGVPSDTAKQYCLVLETYEVNATGTETVTSQVRVYDVRVRDYATLTPPITGSVSGATWGQYGVGSHVVVNLTDRKMHDSGIRARRAEYNRPIRGVVGTYLSYSETTSLTIDSGMTLQDIVTDMWSASGIGGTLTLPSFPMVPPTGTPTSLEVADVIPSFIKITSQSILKAMDALLWTFGMCLVYDPTTKSRTSRYSAQKMYSGTGSTGYVAANIDNAVSKSYSSNSLDSSVFNTVGNYHRTISITGSFGGDTTYDAFLYAGCRNTGMEHISGDPAYQYTHPSNGPATLIHATLNGLHNIPIDSGINYVEWAQSPSIIVTAVCLDTTRQLTRPQWAVASEDPSSVHSGVSSGIDPLGRSVIYGDDGRWVSVVWAVKDIVSGAWTGMYKMYSLPLGPKPQPASSGSLAEMNVGPALNSGNAVFPLVPQYGIAKALPGVMQWKTIDNPAGSYNDYGTYGLAIGIENNSGWSQTSVLGYGGGAGNFNGPMMLLHVFEMIDFSKITAGDSSKLNGMAISISGASSGDIVVYRTGPDRLVVEPMKIAGITIAAGPPANGDAIVYDSGGGVWSFTPN